MGGIYSASNCTFIWLANLLRCIWYDYPIYNCIVSAINISNCATTSNIVFSSLDFWPFQTKGKILKL